jgi:hypothetical protein
LCARFGVVYSFTSFFLFMMFLFRIILVYRFFNCSLLCFGLYIYFSISCSCVRVVFVYDYFGMRMFQFFCYYISDVFVYSFIPCIFFSSTWFFFRVVLDILIYIFLALFFV